MDLAGRVIVITGAASGIGRAMALRFAKEAPAHLVCVDIDGPGAEATAAEVGGTGFRVDVAHEAEIAQLIETVERDIGPIDLFCSNAGISVEGGVEVPDADWQRIWEINVMSHVRAARHLVPLMREVTVCGRPTNAHHVWAIEESVA